MTDDAITSNRGWDTKNNLDFLMDIISEFKINGIRTSVFVDPLIEMVEYAKITGADRVEFFKQNIPNLAEVSIGHALISESLYLGLQNVVNMYLHRLS